mmetsp:Transcript_53827/g.127073  ORF Transcript_53827/g.127073 Transcript_53827/m.127073 type:complete len:185 (-) Transcript_53827:57-611(-)
MLAWSVLYQFLSILACAPIDMIEGFGAATPGTFFDKQVDALQCFFNTHGECDGAWIPVSLFIVAYILTNFTMLGVIKNGSAVFAFICVTIVTPISEFAFSLHFIMGNDTERLYWYHYVSLAVLLVGVCLYRWTEMRKADKEQQGRTTMVVPSSSAYVTLPTNTIQISTRAARARKQRQNQHWTI